MTEVKSTAPRLELDWEEGLFRMVRGLIRKLSPRPSGPQESAAPLEPHTKKLEVLASLVAGRAIRVVVSDGGTGLRGNDILLPPHEASLDEIEDNAEVCLLSTLLLATWRRTGPPSAADEFCPMDDLLGLQAALASLISEFDGVQVRWARMAALILAKRPAPKIGGSRASVLEGWQRDVILQRNLPTRAEMQALLPGRGTGAKPMPLLGRRFTDAGQAEGNDGDGVEPSAGTEKDAPKKIQDVRRTLLPEGEDDKNPIIHTFEKVETLESPQGGNRFADGSDELDDQLEALAEVDLSEVVRGGEPAESILRADFDIEGHIPDVERIEPGETGVNYDEWDFKQRRYLRDWCTVYPTLVRPEDPDYARAALRAHRRQIETLYHRIAIHRSRLRDERRQLDGEEIDLDAAIDAAVEHAAGKDSSGRVYIRRTQQDPDLAAAVLVDVSLSTDSWVLDRRVLDVAKQAVLVLGEVTDRLGDQIAVYAFASKTRNSCRVFEVADFKTPWKKAKARLGPLEPQGYTRIGPAIRHVSAQLAKQTAKRRLLLVITDGKPSDYDKYEGRYGMADIRMSLHEAGRDGIVAHALAIDKTARSHLSSTFGPGAWHVLNDPARLPEVLTEVYGRLSAK